MIHFILGGAKSGKSQYAEQQLMRYQAPWIYLATGRAWDDEMHQKIMRHQQRRGTGWQTVEVPLKLADALTRLQGKPVLIDCLTMWLTNLMMEEMNIERETGDLINALQDFKGEVMIVSNEVGQAIVPENRMARQFVNEAGLLHQKIAAISDHFIMMHAGYPMIIKSVKG